jgi:hypothetical protein
MGLFFLNAATIPNKTPKGIEKKSDIKLSRIVIGNFSVIKTKVFSPILVCVETPQFQ